MAIHTLRSKQVITATLAQAWDFFTCPHNLAKITPSSLGFEITSQDLPDSIYEGMMIEYRVRPMLGIPITWLTEITHVRDGQYFVDEQRIGPYRIWHHEHWFRDLGDNQIELSDLVTYTLPFHPFGELVHPVLVAPQLRRIFAHREQAVKALFP
jgi:ligand-binding SRPBCC domain-containing protein